VALGNLVGNFLGGYLSDRLPAPQALLAFSLVAAGTMSRMRRAVR
jgi:predicted MFS family arabinose efflux permease